MLEHVPAPEGVKERGGKGEGKDKRRPTILSVRRKRGEEKKKEKKEAQF